MSPFLFAVYVNDIENEFIANGVYGIDIVALKIFLLLYAGDIVIFAETSEDLQSSLDILYDYCHKWKLKVNIDKSKVMVFRKGGHLRQNLSFKCGHVDLEIVSKYNYLGIVFMTGGSFNTAQSTLSGQAQKAIFILNKNLTNFQIWSQAMYSISLTNS